MYCLYPHRKLRKGVSPICESIFDYTDGVKKLRPFFLQEIENIMLGLGDWYIVGAVLGSVAVSAIGVIYGAVNWNKGGGAE